MESYNENLHKGANHKLYEYARQLRQTATGAEEILWREIRNKKLDGLKFRRQHPIANFIADFYCYDKKLVIEVDGNVHDIEDVKAKDVERTACLKELEIEVIRFSNEEVITEIKRVLDDIKKAALKSVKHK